MEYKMFSKLLSMLLAAIAFAFVLSLTVNLIIPREILTNKTFLIAIGVIPIIFLIIMALYFEKKLR